MQTPFLLEYQELPEFHFAGVLVFDRKDIQAGCDELIILREHVPCAHAAGKLGQLLTCCRDLPPGIYDSPGILRGICRSIKVHGVDEIS